MRTPSALRHVVVLCDYGHVNGGTAKVAIASIQGMVKAGVKVSFCFGVGPLDPSLSQLGDRLQAHDLQLNDLLNNSSKLSSALQGLWKPVAAQRLARVLEQIDTDGTVIHLHSWMQSLTVSVLSQCLSRPFKFVCTLHDYITACPNGGFYDYQKQAICHRQPLSLPCIATHCDSRSYPHKLWRLARQGIQRHIGKMPSAVQNYITVSPFSESILKPFLPAQARFFKIPNPVDIEKAAPANVAAHERVVFVGKLAPHKGATLLATATAKIGAAVDFLGDGDDQEAVARINPDARLRGWQSGSQVHSAIQTSRCLVFPSVWYETQGLVVLEAAAAGVPSIVSDACAAKDAVINGVTGLLFRSGDVDDLAQKIHQLLQDPAQAARLGHAAHEHYWRQPAALETHVAGLLECYEHILKN